MALINCPECGNSISDQASHCPKCGYQISNHSFFPKTEGCFLQSMYLQPIITQYFIDNKSEIWLLFLIAHSKR